MSLAKVLQRQGCGRMRSLPLVTFWKRVVASRTVDHKNAMERVSEPPAKRQRLNGSGKSKKPKAVKPADEVLHTHVAELLRGVNEASGPAPEQWSEVEVEIEHLSSHGQLRRADDQLMD